MSHWKDVEVERNAELLCTAGVSIRGSRVTHKGSVVGKLYSRGRYNTNKLNGAPVTLRMDTLQLQKYLLTRYSE